MYFSLQLITCSWEADRKCRVRGGNDMQQKSLAGLKLGTLQFAWYTPLPLGHHDATTDATIDGERGITASLTVHLVFKNAETLK